MNLELEVQFLLSYRDGAIPPYALLCFRHAVRYSLVGRDIETRIKDGHSITGVPCDVCDGRAPDAPGVSDASKIPPATPA